ncbi:MAG: aquaporin [Deinococcota bacterium]
MSLRIWLAECIGTFALVFVGVASIASGRSELAIALSFGLTVAVMIAAVGGISFAHFNPAVSVGFFVLGRVSWQTLLLYWSAELAGAIVALSCLQLFSGANHLAAVTYGVTQLSPELQVLQGFGIEVVLTFFLMFVIATCVLQQQPQAGVYIGATVTLCALAGGGLTGASMNPARSFAPALFANTWQHHWLYWLAPCLGAALAALTARYLWDIEGAL